MNAAQKLKANSIRVFSWVVKAAGMALLLLVVVIAIGEGPPNPFELSTRELVLFLSLLMTLIGIVLALRQQLVGGIFIWVGMISFIGESQQWIFYAFILVGILNVLCWCLRKWHTNRCSSKKETL